MKNRLLFIAALIIFLAGCSTSTQVSNPVWIDQLINKFESEAVGNPPQSIYRYEYDGQTVYFVPAQCCDQFSTLYNIGGDVLCAPDGGLTGKGDGKCDDFVAKRSNEQLVWKDPRTR
jgi:hypothetical protein